SPESIEPNMRTTIPRPTDSHRRTPTHRANIRKDSATTARHFSRRARRRTATPDDYVHVSDPSTADAGKALLELYDRALPQVYGYRRVRCGGDAVAEDLTAETFLAACAAVNNGQAPVVSSPWLIGVARHKLVDHWRR